MSNSNRLLMGRVALMISASGFILVLGGCGSGFGAASPPLAAWERVEAEQRECDARMAIQVEAYEKELAELPAKLIIGHQTDAEVKAAFLQAEAWAKAHEQIRLEAFSPGLHCLNEAANKMKWINEAEEWARHNLPRQTMVMDVRTGEMYYYWGFPLAPGSLVSGEQLIPVGPRPMPSWNELYWVQP
jgi:hypothetical protein